MKRVFVAASVLSIVVGSLAFTPATSQFCLYRQNGSATCPLVGRLVANVAPTGQIGNEHIQQITGASCATSVSNSLCTKNYTNEVVE